MKEYSHSFQVRAPLKAVAEFHSSSLALKHLTPPPLRVSFKKIEPLAEGSVADFTIWMGPLPIRWTAIHSNVTPLHGFTDTQESGPFEVWVHHHSFESLDDAVTIVRDQVQAVPKRHFFWGIVSRLMWLNLPILFAFRGWRTRKALEKK